MGKLTLALLGPPEVYYQGQLLHFPTRKSLALLIYLAVEGGLHPREQLDALFWPESEPRQARAALRNTLLRLRATLQDATHLLLDGERLGILPQAEIEVDVHTLDAFLAEAQRGRLPFDEIQRIASLPRGDFLEGFSLPDAAGFDDWAAIQREFCYQKLDQALGLASQEQIDAGLPAGAVETAQRWAALHPLNEAAHRRLMEAYAAAGSRDAALRAYAACQQTLKEELGVEPEQETRDLARRIRSLPSVDSGRAERSRRAATLTTLELPLVGRAELHRSMVQAFRRCAGGVVQAVLLEGEPGIGKTRLARDFMAWATLQGAQVLSGRAFEAGGRLPYQAAAEAVSQALSGARDWEARLGSGSLAELARLLPGLRDRLPGLAKVPGEGDAQAQMRLYDAAARVVEALAQDGPVVWLMDDLQWADSASLDLLQYLAQRWSQEGKGQAVLFLFTLRGEARLPRRAADAGVNLADWLAGWSRVVSTQRYPLRPIREEEVGALVLALSAKETGEARVTEFTRWLYRETEGQPLFIHEMLKALLEWGLIHPQPLPDGATRLELGGVSTQDFEIAQAAGMPSGIRDLFRARLARISQPGLSLLAAGAVLGKGFSFQQAAVVAGLEEETALSALDELLASGLLVEAASTGEPVQPLYLFSHDKLREVIGLETSAARRVRLHRRAFEALEASGASASELSHHALAGGLHAQAFQYSIRAGDQALGLYALREAVRHYRAALLVASPGSKTAPPGADQPSPSKGQALPGLLLNLGRAYELLNEFGPARETYLRLEEFAVQAQRVDLRVVAMNRQATLLAWQSFDLPAAKGLLREALDLSEGSGDGLSRFETAWNLAQLGVYTADAQALEYAQAARGYARELDRPDLLARGWNVLAHVYSLAFRWQEVEQAAKEALRFNERLNDHAMQSENLALVSQAQAGMGRIAEAVEAARRALDIALEIENAWGQVFASFALGLALVDAGQYEPALGVTRRGMQTAGQFQFPALRMLSFVAHGLANLALFRTAEANDVMRQSLDFSQAQGGPNLYTDVIYSMQCAAHALSGGWLEAAQAAEKAVIARRGRPERGFNLPIWLEVEALLRAGKDEAAGEDFEQLNAQPRDHPRQRVSWLVARAALARQAGEHPAALADLEEGRSLAQQAGSAMDRIAVAYELARTCRAAGQLSTVEEYLAEAKRIVDELAARIHDEQLRGQFLKGAAGWLSGD